MTQRSLALAAAVTAVSLMTAGTAMATCSDGHTVAKKEAPVVSTQPPAPKPAETVATTETNPQEKVRTAEAKPAMRR